MKDHLISQAPEEKGNSNIMLVSKGNDRLNLVHTVIQNPPQVDTAVPVGAHTVPMTMREFPLNARLCEKARIAF